MKSELGFFIVLTVSLNFVLFLIMYMLDFFKCGFGRKRSSSYRPFHFLIFSYRKDYNEIWRSMIGLRGLWVDNPDEDEFVIEFLFFGISFLLHRGFD